METWNPDDRNTAPKAGWILKLRADHSAPDGLAAGLPIMSPKNPSSEWLVQALAAVIRKQRLALGMTQQTLANTAGLDRSYIISIEHGQRNLSYTTLVQIAAGLELQASELVRLAEQASVDLS
jgi:DNA-binding XRE family transcriptional regulator